MGVSRPSLWDLAVPSTTLSADGVSAVQLAIGIASGQRVKWSMHVRR